MADDPMLSLFDTDSSSFLDELTGGGGTIGGSGTSLDGNFLGPQPSLQTEPLVNSMQSQQQSRIGQPQEQGFGSPMANISGNQFNIGGISYQNSNTSQQPFQSESYNQYNSTQKLHHMNTQIGPNQGMILPSSSHRQPQSQFGSPPPATNIMQQQQQGAPSAYGSYQVGVQNQQQQQIGPRLPTPHQQPMRVSQNISQNNVWNTNQTSQNQPTFMQQSQQSMMGQQVMPTQQHSSMAASAGGMQQQMTYLTHHDYALQTAVSNASQNTMNHFPSISSANQSNVYMQRMTSPNRLTHVPISSPSNSVNNMGQIQQQKQVVMQQQQQPTFQQIAPQMTRMGPPGVSNTQSQMQIAQPQGQQQYSSFIPQQQQQQMNVNANVQTNSYQRFQFSQNQSNLPQPGIGDNSSHVNLMNTNTSPNQNSPFRTGYPGMSHQRATTPSPRPTPPPSLTPEMPQQHTSPNTQGTPRQPGPMQQMEQLVSPPGPRSTSVTPVSSPFHQSVRTDNVTNQVASNSYMPHVNTNQMTSQVSGTSNNMGNISVNANIPSSNGIGPISPNVNNINTASQNTVSNPNVELQYLHQQLNQLQSVPQTQQTQQKMMEVKERIRSLRANQEMQHHQQQQPFQVQIVPQQQQVQPQPQQQQQNIRPTIIQLQTSNGMQPQQQPLQQQQQQQLQPPPQQQQQQPVLGQRHQLIQIRQPQYPGQPQNQQPQKLLLVTSQGPGGQQTARLVQPMTHNQQPQIQQQPQLQLQQNSSVASPQKVQVLIQSQQTNQQQQPQQQQQPVLSPHLATSNNIPQPVNIPNPTPNQPQVITQMAPPPQGNVPSSVVQLQISGGNIPQQIPAQSVSILPSMPEVSAEENAEPEEGDQAKKRKKQKKNQEKANKIVAEAVARAQAQGLDIPKLMTGQANSSALPVTIEEVQTPEIQEEEGKKKKKRVRKPKEPKTPKEKKEKKVVEKENSSGEIGGDTESGVEGKVEVKKTPKAKTPKSTVKKKKKPPATFLSKKKRKRHDSSDGSDLEIKASGVDIADNDDEGIQKRRSARNTKRKKYLDDVDLNLSDDENQDVDVENTDAVVKPENPTTEEDSILVEKILGTRLRKLDKDIDVDVNESSQPEEEEEVEEFFVKYKNFSYLHCEWKTAEEMERADKRIHQKIKRYKIKKMQSPLVFSELEEDELFNPDYVEVDRVLEVSVTTDPTTDEEVTHFLVKWRGLPYEDSTWELQQDVDPEKVKQFYLYRDPPSDEETEPKPRGTSDEWQKLEKSREYLNGNSLREYQLEGVNWLMFSWHNEQNCILADEMGLGKTIQSITFLNEVSLYGINGPFLVVVPLSTLGNWQREFETWTKLNVIVYHGSSASRNMLQAYEMFYKDQDGRRIPNMYKFHALITTYEVIISDCELLSDIEWRCLIIDEAHRLKNAKCRLMEGLKMFDCEHRVLLSGTPLQNNTEELFSLLSFLEPERFKSSVAFLAEFGELKTDDQVEKLKAILKPMMLRRLKEDVEKNLAAKEETIVEVELTNIQKKYYRAILERNFAFLSKGSGTSANVPNLLNTMMELRKCCNHPYLIKGAEDKILSESKEAKGNNLDNIIQTMVTSSGKMVLLDKLLPKLKQNGHKVLVFSQMIRVLDILEDYLVHKQYLYERLDGRICGKLRQEAIDRFSKPESDRFVFLLCTRAGGLGINLTAADTVIIYDSDWNPQNDLQAQARCHRIGQTKEVKVYRLVTRNSYEREMFDKASLKLGLDKAVLQSMGSDKSTPQAQMSKKEIEELLRKGAYGALMDDDKAGDEFCEEDIDQILQRRTQVIQIESEGKGSTFAKASFSMSGNRTDIDINDPNFWQKWAKKADLNMDEMSNRNELIIEEPRQRKQTTRYGNDDSVLEISELESSSNSDEEEEEGAGGSGGKGRLRGRKRGRPGRKGRKGSDDDYDADDGEGYGRSDCFKVEKNLLIYGWGRWDDILSHGKFKRKLFDKDVEMISRALLIYSLQQYKGDEKIKEFIWDLISPTSDGSLKNHSGLSAPVPRGRKGKNKKKDGKVPEAPAEPNYKQMKNCDPEVVLRDSGYRRHLHRHANKVLLRVRLLYYLKEEIISDAAEKVFQGLKASDIDIPQPNPDGDPPVYWWDKEADKSLLIGVFKHGYEKYNAMRQDPCLSFLERCGPPDGAALAAELNDDDDNFNDDMDESRLNVSSVQDEDEEVSMSSLSDAVKKGTANQPPPAPSETDSDKLPWPTPSDLNTRLRRIITGFQRNHKKMMLKNAQKAKKMERRERFEAALKDRENQRLQYQQWSVPDPFGLAIQHRWTRREESDFYRVISSFGVEFDLTTARYKWDRFRQLARLEKKYDDTLTEYFQAFHHMCMRVCKKFKNDDDALPPNNIYVEPITEERASRCLARIDLLNKIRTETLNHPKLDERIKLCQSSYDMPSWWICGKHDKDLLIGAARHGVVRTDYNILYDPTLSFKEIIKQKHLQVSASPSHSSSPLPATAKAMKEDDSDSKDIKGVSSVEDEASCKGTGEEMKVKSEETSDKEVDKSELISKDGDVSPVKKEEVSPVKKEGVSPEKKEEVSPVKKEEDSPVKKEEDSPVKKEEVSPVKKEGVSPVKKEEASPVKNEEVSPVKSEESPVKKEDISMTDDSRNVSPVKMEKSSPVKSEQEMDVDEQKEPEKTTSEADEDINKQIEKSDGLKSEIKSESFEEKEVLDLKKTDKEGKSEKSVERSLVQEERKSEVPEKFSHEDEELQKFLMKQEEFDGDGLPSEFYPQNQLSASINWPKDRVIFHRLEHICFCVEHNEWPFPKRASYIPMNYDSRSATPVGSTTPRDDQDLSQSDAGDSVYDGVKGDGLKMTFHKRRGGGAGRKYEYEGSRMQHLLSAASSDNESTSENLTPRSQVAGHSPRYSPHHYFFPQTPADILNGTASTPDLDPELLRRSMMEHALYFGDRRGRRGRKRKAEKMAEIAMAEALARRQQARAIATFEPESRVPVINLEDGSRLSGDEAPLKKDLDKWLDDHPGFMVDKPLDMMQDEEELAEMVERKRGRKPKLDPTALDPTKLTGEENVSVVNRLTGKKITGAKAPPMKYLAEWLEQNPFYDVDPKWADLVKTKGNLPESLLSRVVTPSSERRRGRPRENVLSQSVLAGENPFSAASLAGLSAFPGMGLMSGFNKLPLGMPFGTLPNLGMANPMLGLAGFLPGLAASSSALTKTSESESKKEKHSSHSAKKDSSRHESKSLSSSQTPHPSFPMLYNPLMFNPILAAQAQAGLNFSLPTSLPSSFASLAQGSVINGQGDSDLEEGEIKRFSRPDVAEQEMAQDLSVKKVEAHSHKKKRIVSDVAKQKLNVSSSADEQDQPTDLSMKARPKEPKALPKESESKEFTKTKNKIQGSFKLNKILDTLKDKVNKMEDKGSKEKKDKKSKLDSILMKIAKEKDVSVSALESVEKKEGVVGVGQETIQEPSEEKEVSDGEPKKDSETSKEETEQSAVQSTDS